MAGERTVRKLVVVLTTVAAALLAGSLPAIATGADDATPASAAARTILPKGVDDDLRRRGGGQVRVTILLRGGTELLDAARARRHALAPAPGAGARGKLFGAP